MSQGEELPCYCKRSPMVGRQLREVGVLCPLHGDPRDTSVDVVRIKGKADAYNGWLQTGDANGWTDHLIEATARIYEGKAALAFISGLVAGVCIFLGVQRVFG